MITTKRLNTNTTVNPYRNWETWLRLVWTVVGVGVAFAAPAAQPVLSVVKASQTGVPLTHHGDFEALAAGQTSEWRPYRQGFQWADGLGRQQSRAVFCENATGDDGFGVSQTVALGRARVAPLVVRGWSKAESVSGSPDSGYSLYVDLVYEDGTTLWGENAAFRCGTHDWEPRELMILPAKPVRTLTVYALFRGHTGKAWFDDLAVEEIQATGPGSVLWQGTPVQRPNRDVAPAGAPPTYATADGFSLALQDHRIASLRLDGQELAAAAPSGFLARDVAANSDVYGFENGVCPDLGLALRATVIQQTNHLVIEGQVKDTTGRDRAIMVVFALPLDALGWQWGEDIRRHQLIQGEGEFAHTVGVRCGSTGTMSLYPLAAVSNDRWGLAIALDMAKPAQYRVAYHAGTRQLLIAYDVGLVPETARFPGAAEFRFVLYRFDPHWGFRAAFQKYLEIFPEYFVCRATEQGLWMPFTDISKVAGWEDFGFKFHEGNNNVPFDDTQGILSFRYTEPMTWWMPMPRSTPRLLAEALRTRDTLAGGADSTRARMARVTQTAAMTDSDGQPQVQFRREPWCDGAVWSLNPNPHLPGETNAATVYWNDRVKQQLYGPNAKGRLDGEYLDSLEGYVTADLNFNREHFRSTTVPLTFAGDSKQPALFKGFAVFEFTRWLADDLHRMGKLVFANGVPYRFGFLCPWLDVMGTETDWMRGREYEPAPDSTMSLWRTLSGPKPYLLLMNTDYDAFRPEFVEKYFQRCLFYGMFPGMFSHNAADNPYWQNPRWYNRDRPLFKQYLPWIRQVAQAGWQPVTGAACDNPNIWIERFGPNPAGELYLTLFNETSQPQRGMVRLEGEATKTVGVAPGKALLSGQPLTNAHPGLSIQLEPQRVEVFSWPAKR